MVTNKPKLISIGFQPAPYEYTQEEIFKVMGYPRPWFRIFREAQIDRRYFSIPLEKVKALSFQEQQEQYLKSAVEISKRAALNCLDGRDPHEIGCLVYASCTGIAPGPTVGHYLMSELGLKDDVFITNIGGMGCEGGGTPGLKRAVDFTMANHKQSLVIATELSSLSYFPEIGGLDSSGDFELLRGASIFADMSSASLIGEDDGRPDHPFIVDHVVYTKTEYRDKLGYVWQDGRLRLRLDRNVPYYASELAEVAATRLLKRNNLNVDNIIYWVIHAAGAAVLDMIRDNMKIPEYKLRFSRMALSNYGNCSSATPGVIAKLTADNISPNSGEYLVAVTLGPGMTSGASLFYYP